MLGFGQGFQPVAGYNFGAKRYDRVRGATYFTMLVGTVLMSVLAAAGFLAAPGALALFRRDDAEVIAIGALGWLTLARIVRTQTLELKGQEFVEAARSLGIGHMKILFRHIAPNLFGSVIVYTTLAVPGIMLLEAVLSFLGLGVKAPNSSWGTLIKEGADRMEVSPELLLFPALLFSATLLALNFLGDGLRDALDPKSSKD